MDPELIMEQDPTLQIISDHVSDLEPSGNFLTVPATAKSFGSLRLRLHNPGTVISLPSTVASE